MEGHLEPLEVGVQVVPDRLLDVRDRAGLDPAADHVQQPLGRAEADRRQGQRDQQALVVVRDRAVDHRLGQERDGDLGGDRAQGGGEHHDHVDAVGLQVAAEPPQRPDWPYPGEGMRDQRRGIRGHYP